MTDDPYERYLDDFGGVLEHAAAKGTGPTARARRRVRLAVGAAAAGLTAVAIMALSLIAPGGGGRRLDVVAEARAALAPRGGILHTIVRRTVELPADHPPGVAVATAPQTAEEWRATGPARWRVATTFPNGSGHFVYHGARMVGAVQYAYADGEQSTYAERRNTLHIVSGVDRLRPATAPAGSSPEDDPDPVGTIRALLAKGSLHDRGIVTVDGQPARRLVGTVPRAGHLADRLEYDVDPSSYVPMLARLQRGIPADRRLRSSIPIVVLRFLRFERLPLTPKTERMLRIEPRGTPTVTRSAVAAEAAQGAGRRAARRRTLRTGAAAPAAPPAPRRGQAASGR